MLLCRQPKIAPNRGMTSSEHLCLFNLEIMYGSCWTSNTSRASTISCTLYDMAYKVFWNAMKKMHIYWTCLPSLASTIHDVLIVNKWFKLFEPLSLRNLLQFVIRWIIFQIFSLFCCSKIQFWTPRKGIHASNHTYHILLVRREGHRPVQVKWITAETLQSNFTHLVEEAGTLLVLNREELGNQEKTHSFGNI